MTDEATGNDESPELKERHRLHDAQRSELLDRQRSNTESYDKAVLTLASGSLALSLSFIKDILPNVAVPVFTSMLYWSWALLTFAIITTIASYLLSNCAIDQALEKSYDYYIKEIESAFKKTKLMNAVDWINIGSGVLFILGIALTVLFVGVNFHEVKSMKKVDTDISLSGGHSVPHMQKVDAGPLKRGQSIPNLQPVSAPTQTAAPQSGITTTTAPVTAAPANPSKLKK